MLARQFRDVSDGKTLDSILGRDVQAQMEQYLNESILDYAVALALDAPYSTDGKRAHPKKSLVISNEFVSELVSKNTKLLYGASVHPYRPDAISTLEKVIKEGACLIKWLPAAQNIDPQDTRCFPFYEILAEAGLPLLCHTGGEHILKVYSNCYNDPDRLRPALERGVTVIAAHCGTRMFLNEKCYFSKWTRMAREYENFYGDLAAFLIWTRLRPLRTILKEPALTAKVLFGSDFPSLHFPFSYLGKIGIREALSLRNITNPFDQAVLTFKAAGVPDAVFSRAQHLLRHTI